jgi:hypothetical protein
MDLTGRKLRHTWEFCLGKGRIRELGRLSVPSTFLTFLRTGQRQKRRGPHKRVHIRRDVSGHTECTSVTHRGNGDTFSAEKVATLRTRSDSHGLNGPSNTYFDGQQVLQLPRNNPKSRTGQQQNKPLRDGTIPDCHNCGSKNHLWRRARSPRAWPSQPLVNCRNRRTVP